MTLFRASLVVFGCVGWMALTGAGCGSRTGLPLASGSLDGGRDESTPQDSSTPPDASDATTEGPTPLCSLAPILLPSLPLEPLPTSLKFGGHVAKSDFNHDGSSDLVVVAEQAPNALVLLGRGDGTFSPAVKYALAETNPGPLGVGDVDGDGEPDIITLKSVLFGRGTGAFGRRSGSPCPTRATTSTAGS